MMKDIIYIFIYLLTEILNYCLVYHVIFGASITKSIRKWVVAIGIVVVLHIILLQLFGREGSSALSLFSMIIIPVLILEQIEKKNFFLYPFVVIGTSVIGVCLSFLFASFLHIPEYVIAEGDEFTILCQVVQAIPVLVFGCYRKIKREETYEVHLDWKQYTLFYIVVICLFLMLTPLQNLTRGVVTSKHINTIGFAVSIACIVLVIITVWQGIAVKRGIQLKEQNRMNMKYMELQKEYYINLLDQDEKMRRFRHDMNAHIMAIRSYCQESDNQELLNYLNKIVHESAINSVDIYTGNKRVDAVLRPLLNDAMGKSIDIEVKGRLTEFDVVKDFDLCTIFSNLLKNAIEGCEKIPEISKRKIIVSTSSYNAQVYICIKNTIKENVLIKNNRCVSTKEKSRYTGLGSGNIKSAIHKNNGIVEYSCESGWFTAEINL